MRLFLFFISNIAFLTICIGWSKAFLGEESKKKGLYIQAQRLTGCVMLYIARWVRKKSETHFATGDASTGRWAMESKALVET